MLSGKWAIQQKTIPSGPYQAVGPMGSVHIQTSSGKLVYNVPYANKAYAKPTNDEESLKKIRMPGSVIREGAKSKGVIAGGAWLDDYDVTSDTAYKDDPHHMDETGSAIVQGNFFANDQESEHFAIGAPKANRLTGRVYVCYKCFYPKAERKDGNNRNPSFQLEVESSSKQTGERFGAAVAAVDVDGDGIDELVISAPLYSSEVSIDNGYNFILSKSLQL